MSRLFAACVLVFAVGTATAEDQVSRVPRTDSLELPGLTACHICEWRPKLNQMPAAEQCGTEESGTGKIGLFECGFSQECERECHFLRCGSL
ncbi:MAG TPA: hypothetical protein VHB46_09005 [Burkholderiales bacterium]|nr:hypothetical protein [Burkholderiales bacterium]